MASKFWVLSNEDSRAKLFRENHVKNNGGTWAYSPVTGWTWNADFVKEEKIEETPKKKTRSIFKRKGE